MNFSNLTPNGSDHNHPAGMAAASQNPLAEAREIERRVKECGSVRNAARQLKCKVADIRSTLRLLELPEDVLARLESGELPPAMAAEVVKLSDPADQRAMVAWYLQDQSHNTVTNPPKDGLHQWALSGVIVMAVLSSLLNGFANSQHAEIYWAAWAMGLVIPLIVFILGKVAGLLWKRGNAKLAYAVGGTGVCLLFLSVFHCSQSICLLTGSQWFLGLPLAIAIDCGLVTCEIAAIVED